MSENPYLRQNDRTAIGLLKASYRCLKKERDVKYAVIAASFIVCLFGILNKYLPAIFSRVDNILTVQQTLSTYINLVSGVVMIGSLVTSFYTHRMHVEGVCLQERFDCYVYGAPVHHSVTRPISQTVIDVYAAKVKRRNDKFKYIYYDNEDDYDPHTAHFDNINRQLHGDYRLYLSVQPFFLTVWIGFCIVVFLLALSFDDKFINTLINILFPSMSAITVIGNSWFAFRQQMRQLTTAIAAVDNIMRLPDRERMAAMTDKMTLRMLQDSLFNYRLSAFVIPNFLINRHKKQLEKENWSGQLQSSDLIIALGEKKTKEVVSRRQQKKLNRMTENTETETLAAPPVKTVYLPEIRNAEREIAAVNQPGTQIRPNAKKDAAKKDSTSGGSDSADKKTAGGGKKTGGKTNGKK